MVIVSGMITSRDDLLAAARCGACPVAALRRGGGSRRRERVRSSSSPVAAVTVRRPRRRSSSPGAWRGVGLRRRDDAWSASPGRRMMRLASSSLLGARPDGGDRRTARGAPAAGTRRGAAGALLGRPRRRAGAWPRPRPCGEPRRRAWRRASSSRLRRFGGLALGARRFALGAAAASISARRRSSSSRRRASASAMARASRSSSVSVRSTMPPTRCVGAAAASARLCGRAGRRGRAGERAAAVARRRAARRRSCSRRAGAAAAPPRRCTTRPRCGDGCSAPACRRADDAALHLLDDDRLGAAVREALAYDCPARPGASGSASSRDAGASCRRWSSYQSFR